MKIKKNFKKIGVIGLGYVGLPLALNFGKLSDIIVYGYDNDKKKINQLLEGKSYINHINSKSIKSYNKKNFFLGDLKKISEVDIIFLCLPTPLKDKNKPDLSYIKSSLNKIFPYLKKRTSNQS